MWGQIASAAGGMMGGMGGGGGGGKGKSPDDWTKSTPQMQTQGQRNTQIAKQSPVDDDTGRTRTKLGGVF